MAETLSEESSDIFKDMLQNLTLEDLCEVRDFAIYHSEHSKTLVEIILSYIQVVSDPPQKQIARLKLVSEVLLNCNNTEVPQVWSYRRHFLSKLPSIFNFLNKVAKYHSQESQVFSECTQVLLDWEVSSVFDAKFIRGLEFNLTFKDSEINGEFFRVYREALRMCEEVVLRVKCKNNGLISRGSINKLVGRLTKFQAFKVRKNSVSNLNEVTLKVDQSDPEGTQPLEIVEQLESYTEPSLTGEQIFQQITQKYSRVKST